VTKGLYFSMLEAGMSLVAVNLPSLWFLFSQRALASPLRSIRSALSLRSFASSKRSDHASRSVTPRATKDSFSASSSSHLTHDADGDAHESFNMRDQGVFDVEKLGTTKAPVAERPHHREELYPH
jgi:hypothetical protein